MLRHFSNVRFFANIWRVACQAPLSMGFSRQECWSGLPFPSPGDLPDTGVKPSSPALQADSLPPEPPEEPKERKGGSQRHPCILQTVGCRRTNPPKLQLRNRRPEPRTALTVQRPSLSFLIHTAEAGSSLPQTCTQDRGLPEALHRHLGDGSSERSTSGTLSQEIIWNAHRAHWAAHGQLIFSKQQRKPSPYCGVSKWFTGCNPTTKTSVRVNN